MSEQPAARPGSTSWTIEDVRDVTALATFGDAIPHVCGLCGCEFDAAAWLALSVARDRRGGMVVPVCASCALEHWEAIKARMAFVAEMLAAATAHSD